MLTDKQRDAIRQKLKAELVRITDNAENILDFTKDRDRDRTGRDSIDESTEEELYSTALRLADRETFLFGKIKSALSRLEAGDIDACEDCGQEIGYDRLLARPVTTLCIECKTEREHEEAAVSESKAL